MSRFPLVVVFLSTSVMIGCGTVPPLTPTSSESVGATSSPEQAQRIGASAASCRGAKSLGYWTAHTEDISASDLAALASLLLRTADGAMFHPNDQQSVGTWLKDGSKAVDLYGLSVQLAVAVLNVGHGFVDPNAVAVLIQQAQIQLTISSPSAGWTQELVREFTRCQ